MLQSAVQNGEKIKKLEHIHRTKYKYRYAATIMSTFYLVGQDIEDLKCWWLMNCAGYGSNKKKRRAFGINTLDTFICSRATLFFPVDRALTNKVSNPQENLISVSKNL